MVERGPQRRNMPEEIGSTENKPTNPPTPGSSEASPGASINNPEQGENKGLDVQQANETPETAQELKIEDVSLEKLLNEKIENLKSKYNNLISKLSNRELFEEEIKGEFLDFSSELEGFIVIQILKAMKMLKNF